MKEAFYKTIYTTMKEGLYVFDAQGKILHVNPATLKILGFSEAEMLGKVGHELFHEHAFNEHMPKEECPIFKAQQRGVSYFGEEVFRTKQGNHITAEVSCTPLLDETGSFGYLVLFRDISKRKQIEEEVMVLSRVVKEMQDAVAVRDMDLRIITANEAFLHVVEKESLEEVTGKTEAQVLGVDEESPVVRQCMEHERLAQHLPAGESVTHEKAVTFANGESRVYKVRKFPIHSQCGAFIATVSIGTDITTQREYEETLKEKISQEAQKRTEHQAFFNKIFETANLGICLTNTEGRFVVVNPAYCKIYGYTEAELIGEHFTKVVPPEQHEAMNALHDAFIAGETTEIPYEWDVLGKGGKEIHVVATAGILEHIVGGPYKITTITDMTDVHKERVLQKHQEALLIQQSKLASMGEMLGAIAHQWRQPLNVINCTTLDMRLKKQMGLLDDAYFNEAIAELSHMTQSMSRTIDDFMNFFKPSKQKKDFSLRECVEYANNILLPQLNAHGICVHNEVPKEAMVYGTMGELEQVILNLLSNARDAFEDKEVPEKTIRFYTNALEGGDLELVVEDTAGGIDEALIGKIFDPYFTTKGDKQGTGIGLYMCTTIIEKTFNGTIRAVNWYNDAAIGTRILLRFPTKEQQ
ncbi:MAG: PAS domain S-box protein [Campylobacterales bacterium]|nr:PAS domain S-box protein [Campylobacterales bacterium]